MPDVTLEDIFESLNDLDYPASKQDVVRHADTRGASEEVLRTLRALPLADHSNRLELSRSLDTAESGAGRQEERRSETPDAKLQPNP